MISLWLLGDTMEYCVNDYGDFITTNNGDMTTDLVQKSRNAPAHIPKYIIL